MSGAPLERGCGSDRRLHFDAFSGLSGDMLVAALLDLGIPLEPISTAIDALQIADLTMVHGHVERSGIRARRFEVRAPASEHERTHAEISQLLGTAALRPGVRDRALAAFALLAQAESEVHAVPLEDVHFHEVGAIDSIVDVVAVSAALEHLGAAVSCSPLPMGHGTVRSRHGVLPLPAPATVRCLMGVPTYDGGVEAELVTPTGACLVATATEHFVRWPPMRVLAVGYGAGALDLPDRPNVLRVILGRPEAEPRVRHLTLLETNLDDASPELLAHALERLRDAGARDAWATPIQMKKGRGGTKISALVDPGRDQEWARILMTETPTLGVRLRVLDRWERTRRRGEVETRFGTLPVKVADGDGLPLRVKPEYDACAAAARAHGRPLHEVQAAALAAAFERLGSA